jgi:hypothetical protein
VNIETEPPRVANRSDALDLISTLIELVEGDPAKKSFQLWYGLITLKDSIERGLV